MMGPLSNFAFNFKLRRYILGFFKQWEQYKVRRAARASEARISEAAASEAAASQAWWAWWDADAVAARAAHAEKLAVERRRVFFVHTRDYATTETAEDALSPIEARAAHVAKLAIERDRFKNIGV